MLRKGQQAPDFTLQTAEGRKLTLKEALGEGPVVLAFFKSSCPVCQFTFPFLERLHRASRRVHFYAVSQDSLPTAEMFVSEHSVSFPILLDRFEEGYPASNAYGIRTVPAAFLVERDGTIAWTMEGFDKAALEELGARAGAAPFREGEDVPVFQPG